MVSVKCKGKSKAPQGMTGSWVCGFYCEVGGESFIIEDPTPMTQYDRGDYLPRTDMIEIEYKSQCTFTGLQDISGKDAYYGDILETKDGIRYTIRWMDISARFVLVSANSNVESNWLSAAAIPSMVIVGETE